MKTKIIFFARSFHTKFFAEIESDIFESYYVTLTREERIYLESKNKKVHGCFEDEYKNLKETAINGNYLKTAFSSDRFLNRFNNEKRIEILGKEITFWKKIFGTIEPDYIVSETVAIEISEVMAIEAQKMNIHFLCVLIGFLPDTFYFKPNPFHGSINNLNTIIPSQGDLFKAQEYINNVIAKNQRPIYINNSLSFNRFSVKTLIGSTIRDSKTFFKEKILQKTRHFKYEDYSIFTFKWAKLFINSVIFSYDTIDKIENKKVVFFPLHFEPEATLSYFAEEYFDQAGTIINISRAIKTNQILVVKEHPQQPGALLQRKYRELKKQNSNIIFLPSEIVSFTVLKKCDAIVTLTSTAAWEGVLLGKPVFVLGKIFFDQCPGVTVINDFKHLKSEIRKENYNYPDKNKTLNFTASFISTFHKGSPHIYANGDSKQHVANFTKAIEMEIQKV